MKWNIDPTHSNIQFSVRHMGLSTVRGTFGQLSGTISEEDGHLQAGEADIDLASINTNMAARDEHLRGPDFFDVAANPTAHFHLLKADRNGRELTVTGELSIRGMFRRSQRPPSGPAGSTRAPGCLQPMSAAGEAASRARRATKPN
jgi:polyisoprenoid-binding protein YceI